MGKAAHKTSVEETKGAGKTTLGNSSLHFLPSENHMSRARPQCHQGAEVSYKICSKVGQTGDKTAARGTSVQGMPLLSETLSHFRSDT